MPATPPARSPSLQMLIEFVRSGDTVIVTGLDQLVRPRDQGRLGLSAIARRLGVGPARVYRVLGRGAA
jgi:DNA invertase Pin-like site-specific DNA recombinase